MMKMMGVERMVRIVVVIYKHEEEVDYNDLGN